MSNFPQRLVPPSTAFSRSKTRRPRQENGAHLKWLRTLPCLVTGQRGSVQACHVRYADPMFGKREVGMQEKPDDMWTVPLNAMQHRDQHDHGDERNWWKQIGIDPLQVALTLHHITGDDELAESIIREARQRRLNAKAER